MLLTIGEIIQRFRTHGACVKFSKETITHMANVLGFHKQRRGGKIGYDQSLITAITQRFNDAVAYENSLKQKVPQKSLKQPKMGDYYTYNGERDNIDYEWEKNEGNKMNLDREVIKESVRKSIKNFILNEISSIAKNTDVTVCGVEDFTNLCRNFPLNDNDVITLTDQNVESLVGEYAFIEIRDSFGRVKVEFPLTRFYNGGDVNQETNDYYDKLWYFKSDHKNVIRLEYDDTQNFGKKGNGITGGAISPDRLNDRYKLNKKGEPRQKSYFFSYGDGKDFDDTIAEQLDRFIEDNIKLNPHVKFIIHCRAGASRSAGIGTFIAKIKQEIYQDKEYMQKFFKEHLKSDGTPQFDLKVDRKGNASYPHQKEMKKLGARRGWNKENDDTYLQWYINDFIDSGFYGDYAEKMRERQKELRNKKLK